MNLEIISSRRYGEPKLEKPKELKGIKQSGGAMFGPKCKCPVFVTESSVYVKHRDWFSRSISIPEAVNRGIISKQKSKFIYNDNFGSVVLRNEAWLKIEVDWDIFKPQLVNDLIRRTEWVAGLREFDLENHDWVRFYEDIISIQQLGVTEVTQS